MHIVILVLTAMGGAIWWWVRSNPREAIGTAADLATTVANAPRRLAFRKQTNAHPVEGIDDPRIAITAIAQAFIELDALPTKEQRDALTSAMSVRLDCTKDEITEMEVLGRWLVTQCQGAKLAVPRIARRLKKIDDGRSWDRLQDMLGHLVQDDLSSSQESAIEDLKLAFRR
ncbi:MAG: hypothetical protein HKP29_04955 [Silicimonas sp.]|nr:hypothetical protein [Silicimonas sp.]